jgi:DNA-directed RNA polymerase specialized sigma24 family protein
VLAERAGWDRLLELFPGDAAAKAAAFGRLRDRLVSFFRWKGGRAPDELADEVLARIATKLDTGERVDDLRAYALGVARLVYLESVKSDVREREALAQAPTHAEDPPDELLAALEECLRAMAPDDATLVREYLEGSGQARIDARAALAKRLETSLNALRIRAFRLRERLEACVRKGISKT